jgi:hypothetical protein
VSFPKQIAALSAITALCLAGPPAGTQMLPSSLPTKEQLANDNNLLLSLAKKRLSEGASRAS